MGESLAKDENENYSSRDDSRIFEDNSVMEVRYDITETSNFNETRALFIANITDALDMEDFKSIMVEEAKKKIVP